MRSAMAPPRTCVDMLARWEVRGELELPMEPEVARSPKSASAKEYAMGV